MYVRRRVTLFLFVVLGALTASAQTISIVPVATAQVRDRLNTTTLAFRNDGRQEAVCDVFYALPNDPKGGALRGRYTLPAGGVPQIELNAFSEAAAIGSLQIRCSAAVVIAARIQASTDGGVTFDEGRTYAAVDEASGFRGSRTVAVDSDLFVAEVLGKPVTFEAVVTSNSGSVVGRESYAIKAFAQKTLDLSDLRSAPTAERPASVTIRVTSGDGAVVVGKETRDRDLLQLVAGRDRQFTLSANAVSRAVSAASPSHTPPPRLGTASFQAAPFQDSFTGLVYFRNRWYDPRTGSWLTPDPTGYQDSANTYAFAAGDPVNGRDPTGLCLGLDKAGRACSEYARMLPGLVAESLGYNRIPSTGNTRVDATIQRIAQSPARLAAVPAAALLATGESTGEAAYRMERAMFHNEQAFDASVGDALLAAGVMTDVATVAAPLGMLEGRLTVKRGPATRATVAPVLQEAVAVRPAVTSALDAQRALAEITERVSAQLSANPRLAMTVLSPREYAAAQRSARLAAAQYGNAIERLVAREVANDPQLASVIRHIGGPNQPDFVAFGQNYDLTTETATQVYGHMNRTRYGPGLGVVTYRRPSNLGTFP